jgi:hypothetical protein
VKPPVTKGREYVVVARNPRMGAWVGYPTTHEIAVAEAKAKLIHWPDASVAIYRLVPAITPASVGGDA